MLYEQQLTVVIDSNTRRIRSIRLNIHQEASYLRHREWEDLRDEIDTYFAMVSDKEIEEAQILFERKRLDELLATYPIGACFKKDHHGFVYVMRSGDSYKIGRSIDPDKRFRQLQYENPAPEEIVHLIESDQCRTLEAGLHGVFMDKQLSGEWFSLGERDLSWLKTL